jgi:cephalosporin-C deacetylase
MRCDEFFSHIAQMKFRRMIQCFTVILISGCFCRAQMLVSPDRSNGVYSVGETVHWRAEWTGETSAPAAQYKFLSGGLTDAGHGDLNFSNKVSELETKFESPGTMLVEVKWNSTNRALAGAVASPEKITLSAPRPKDFDTFWKAKVMELEKIPANPQLEGVNIGKTNLLYWKITMDNIRGTHIHGQLARPASGKKFPVLLIPQWAGVYPLQRSWVTDRANEGWLVLNIIAHDLPIDEPENFYTQQSSGPLNNYAGIGNDDRDTSYFLRMYLSCYRAAEYLRGREDWNGKTLVVSGGSQGGQQTLMIAGLYPKFTAALALVPAGCDMLGPDIGRAPGWPKWYSNLWGKDPQKVHEASRYYDVANFTPNIKCPVLVGIGLIDEVCPPAGIFAAMNQVKSPKEILILQKSGHQNEHGSQEEYYRRSSEWLLALAKGKPAPVRK